MSTILLVDDDSTYLRVLCQSLMNRKYEVRIAESIDTALNVAKLFTPEYVVLDLKMPGGSGLKLIPELLKIDPCTKILILTGYANVKTAVEAIKLGAVNYLSKPADTDEIIEALYKLKANPNIPIEGDIPTLSQIEENHIKVALSRNKGNISQTAIELGLHRRTLQRKLDKMTEEGH